MSMMSHDAASFRSTAIAPFMFDDVTPQQPDEGYAFETALCLVECQSPSLRPASIALPDGAPNTIIEWETQVLLERARLLERLLAGVRGCLNEAEWRTLLDAADRVSAELTAALMEISARDGTQSDLRRPGKAELR